MSLIKSISGIRGTIGGPAGEGLTPLDVVKFTSAFATFLKGERSKVKGERLIDISYSCEGFLGEYEQKVRDHFFYCRSGVEVASIRCDGGISGCTSVRSNMDQGNIYKDDFWDVWQNRFQVMRDRSWARKGQCENCKVWRYCEGSGLHLYDDNGDLLCCHYKKLKVES